MSLEILAPGLQTTLQGAPRTGLRHTGVPWSGPADPLSLALANRLVANPARAVGLEVTMGGLALRFTQMTAFALAGAESPASLDGAPVAHHATRLARPGAVLALGSPPSGLRTYLAIAGGLAARDELGARSTYLPAGLGGHKGRALRAGDRIASLPPTGVPGVFETPRRLRPVFQNSWALRACTSAETGWLTPQARTALYDTVFRVSRRADRMGLHLEGGVLEHVEQRDMESAPVFPGTLQIPPDGQPILLLCDAQTTGGYPRLAQVARADRHLMGQMRPGDRVRFLARSPERAIADLQAKDAWLAQWLAEPVL